MWHMLSFNNPGLVGSLLHRPHVPRQVMRPCAAMLSDKAVGNGVIGLASLRMVDGTWSNCLLTVMGLDA